MFAKKQFLYSDRINLNCLVNNIVSYECFMCTFISYWEKRNEELESTILERNSLTMLPQQTKQGILYIQYTCTIYVIIII